MRSSTTSYLAASTLLVLSARAQCSDKSIDDLVEAFGCGDAYTIGDCLSQATEAKNFFESCALSHGCLLESVRAGQYWMQEDCNKESHPRLQSALQQWLPIGMELRKRATSSETTAEQTTAETTTAETKATTSTEAATTSSPASTAATTTADSTTGTSSASTSSVSGLSTASGSTSLVCLATSQSTYTYCATTTPTAACITSTTPIVSCAAGNICETGAAGAITCMKTDNSLDTSGFVVTIGFAVIAAAMIGSLLFMCFSSRKASKIAQAHRDSQFFGASNKAASSEANLPLIAQAGPAGGQQGTFDQFADRPGAHRVPSSNYGDVVNGSRGTGKDAPQLPKLHPGLMSTPGGSFDSRDEDISYQGARK